MSFLSQQLQEFFRLQTYTGGLYCLFIDKYKALDTFLFLANEKHSVNEVIVGCNALQNVLLKSMSRSYIICNKKIDIIFSRHFHSNPYCKFVVLNSIRKYLYYLYLLVINNCKLQLNNKQKSYALHRLVIYEFYDVCMYYPKEAMSLFWSISQTFDTSITCEPYKVSNTISLGFKLCSPFLFKLWQRILIHYSMLQIELNTFFKFIFLNWYRIAKAWYILKAHAFS